MSEKDLVAKLYKELKAGEHKNETVEMEIPVAPKNIQLAHGSGIEIGIGDIFGGMLPQKTKKKLIEVEEAYKILMEVESDKLIDEDSVNAEAIRRAENEGIIFVDEIDKIAAKANNGQDVSREGVQRDILPIVEGSTISTKYGQVKTDYILFIAAGAFHIASVDDLIPELQGRFPIKVTLDNLSEKDFVEILKTTDNSILTQYTELLKVDNVLINFNDDAIAEIAKIAAAENENNENIGARRLHTIMEKLLQDISYEAGGLNDIVTIEINRDYVLKNLDSTIKTLNLKKYIL